MDRRMVLTVVVLAAATWAFAGERLTPQDYVAIADRLADSLVRVEYTLQYDKGESPRRGAQNVREERPLEAAGFLLSPTQVVSADLLMHPRFIKSVAVRFGTQVVDARLAAYAKHRNARFLELAEPLAGARPLVFDAKKGPPYLAVDYDHHEGTWRTAVWDWSPSVSVTESGRRFLSVPDSCLIVDREGTPVGMSMKDELPVDDSWKGSPLEWETCSAAELSKMLEELDQAAARSLLRVELGFRSPRKRERDSYSYMRYSEREDGATVRNVAGMLIDEHRVLVLVSLEPKVTARLQRIVVYPPEGEPVSAKFTCTLSDYGCFLAELEQPLPGPMVFSSSSIMELEEELLPSVEATIQGEQRVVYLSHARITSFEMGWKRQVYPEVPMDDDDLFLFEPGGSLVALPVARREKVAAREPYYRRGFLLTPAALLKQVLDQLPGHTDPSNIPLSEEEENRLAWLGAELQPLDRQLARANNVSDLTQDGEFGALVAYVYPDSPAAQAGIETGYILIRLHMEGEPKPLDVDLDGYRYSTGTFPWDRLDELPEQLYDQVSTPWPSAENSFTRSLTDLGFGKKYTAEFFHDGQVVKKEFETVESPPHYDAAARYKSEELGLTVRDLTYEVRRYFQKTPDDPGVIISRLEPGSKASVSGIKPYEIITHVNDAPVKSVQEFQTLIKDQEELRFSILRMTRERQVRIKMEVEAEKEETEPTEE